MGCNHYSVGFLKELSVRMRLPFVSDTRMMMEGQGCRPWADFTVIYHVVNESRLLDLMEIDRVDCAGGD